MMGVHNILTGKEIEPEYVEEPQEVQTGGGGGTIGGMEARVTKLENIAEKTGERLGRMEQDLVVIKTQMDSFTKHYATKADVVQAKNSIIMWVVSAILLAQLLPAILAKLAP